MTPDYHPYYCEENIRRLCDHMQSGEACYVVFVSNTARMVALWGQGVVHDPQDPVLWDYHVVLLHKNSSTDWVIWDLDCRAGAPLSARRWLTNSFPHTNKVRATFQPSFRLVECAEFVRTFVSDRSHMLLDDGRHTHPPPPWPAYAQPGQASNLMRFVDMEQEFVGRVVDLEGLEELLKAGASSSDGTTPSGPVSY